MSRVNQIVQMILKEMKKQELSSKDLAQMAGCTSRYINYIKEGKQKDIGIDYADRILKALNLEATIGEERNETRRTSKKSIR